MATAALSPLSVLADLTPAAAHALRRADRDTGVLPADTDPVSRALLTGLGYAPAIGYPAARALRAARTAAAVLRQADRDTATATRPGDLRNP